MNYIWIHIKYNSSYQNRTNMGRNVIVFGSVIAVAVSMFSNQPDEIKKKTLKWVLVLLVLLLFSTRLCNTFCHRPFHVDRFSQVKGGNNMYMVHEDLTNPELAAETMDRLNSVATQFIARLHEKYIIKDGLKSINLKYKNRVRDGVKSLKKNFKTANMQENLPSRSGGDTSYVINKGEVFAMCLRDPKNGNKVDEEFNTLKFVLFHELSHLFSSTFGHDDIFWNNFRFVLHEAISMGLYQKVNYKQHKSPYCGIVVTYSPLYDSRLVDYLN